MLKAPLLILGPTFLGLPRKVQKRDVNMFKICSKFDNAICPIKKVDNDAILLNLSSTGISNFSDNPWV